MPEAEVPEPQDEIEAELRQDAVYHIEVPVLASLEREALELVTRLGVSRDEGMAVLFAAGVAALRAELARHAEGGDEKDLLHQLQWCQARFAALKYKTFLLDHDSVIIRTQLYALRNEITLLKRRIDLFREDEACLKAELTGLRQRTTDSASAPHCPWHPGPRVRWPAGDDGYAARACTSPLTGRRPPRILEPFPRPSSHVRRIPREAG